MVAFFSFSISFDLKWIVYFFLFVRFNSFFNIQPISLWGGGSIVKRYYLYKTSFALWFVVTCDRRLSLKEWNFFFFKWNWKYTKNCYRLWFAYMRRAMVRVMYAHGTILSMKSNISLSSCHWVAFDSKIEWMSVFVLLLSILFINHFYCSARNFSAHYLTQTTF